MKCGFPLKDPFLKFVSFIFYVFLFENHKYSMHTEFECILKKIQKCWCLGVKTDV